MSATNNRAVDISVIMLCQVFQTAATAGIALFVPSIRRDLGLSFTQAGTLSAVTVFCYALMQIPAGYLADRHGLKQIFFLGVFGTTLLCLTFGLVSNYWHAFLNQAASGIFHAFLFQAGLALLASWFGAQRRATAMGLSLVGIFSGQVLMNSLGPLLLNRFNWRFPFISFGLAGILASLIYLWLGQQSSHSDSKRLGVADAVRLFRYRFMWVCGIIQYIRLGIMAGISFWLPSFLIDERGLSLQETGVILAFRTLLIAPSNMLGGYLSDRLRNPTAVMGVSLVILAITAAALVKVTNVALLVGLIFLNAVFIQFYFGPIFALPVEKYGAHMTGTLSGFGNFFANLGAFTFTYLLGLLKDQTGRFEAGFYTIAAASLVGVVFTIWLEQMRRH
ncbi:MAG: MFS transporter [Deltaproteobacteria bacterium]|nr:MFS transporter [Deltaproteobacteria bacterium]